MFDNQTCWCCTEWPDGFKNVWTDKMFYNVWSNVRRRSNIIEHDPTRSNKVSKRENVWSPSNVRSFFFCLFIRLVFFTLEFHTLLTELTFLIHCVWLPNIFHLNSALYIFQSGENRQNFILYSLILWNQGSCMVFAVFFCCLITFFVSAEGRRKDPEEFWSTSIVDRLKIDHEEALASQQETQMIFFIQQVAKNSKKKSTTVGWFRLVTQYSILFRLVTPFFTWLFCNRHASFSLYVGKIALQVRIRHAIEQLAILSFSTVYFFSYLRPLLWSLTFSMLLR